MTLTTEQGRAMRVARIDRLSELLDSRYRIPGTCIRFGWDAVVGLVPVAGDLVMTAVSLSLLFDAHRLGVPRALLARMLLNLAIDGVVGSIPFVGPVFDVFFRANERNFALLVRHLQRELTDPAV